MGVEASLGITFLSTSAELGDFAVELLDVMQVCFELGDCLLISELEDWSRDEAFIVVEVDRRTHSDFICLPILWAIGDPGINLHRERYASVRLYPGNLPKILLDKVGRREPREIG